jgi:hypothetical protein
MGTPSFGVLGLWAFETTGLGALAMAERVRGEADRLDPAGLS